MTGNDSENILRDLWTEVVGIGKEVAKIDGIAKVVDEIKAEVKEQRDDISSLTEAKIDLTHRVKALEEAEGPFTPEQIDQLKKVSERHKLITGLIGAGTVSAIAIGVIDAAPHILKALGHS